MTALYLLAGNDPRRRRQLFARRLSAASTTARRCLPARRCCSPSPSPACRPAPASGRRSMLVKASLDAGEGWLAAAILVKRPADDGGLRPRLPAGLLARPHPRPLPCRRRRAPRQSPTPRCLRAAGAVLAIGLYPEPFIGAGRQCRRRADRSGALRRHRISGSARMKNRLRHRPADADLAGGDRLVPARQRLLGLALGGLALVPAPASSRGAGEIVHPTAARRRRCLPCSSTSWCFRPVASRGWC